MPLLVDNNEAGYKWKWKEHLISNHVLSKEYMKNVQQTIANKFS
jgi:hypothetical protein